MKYFVVRKILPQTVESKRGAIQYLYLKGLKVSEISKELRISRPMVYKWINIDGINPPRRKSRKFKLKNEHFEFMIHEAANKFGIKEEASSRNIRNKIFRRFGELFATSTINRHLNRLLSKPRKPRKAFFLSKANQAKRKEFAECIIEKEIQGRDLFFTNEKKFMLHRNSNHQTCRMRLTKENEELFKNGDSKIFELLEEPVKKFEEGFMVAGGISWFGVSKLIFCIGTMNHCNSTNKIFNDSMRI